MACKQPTCIRAKRAQTHYLLYSSILHITTLEGYYKLSFSAIYMLQNLKVYGRQKSMVYKFKSGASEHVHDSLLHFFNSDFFRAWS
jgi:hypothetical protein